MHEAVVLHAVGRLPPLVWWDVWSECIPAQRAAAVLLGRPVAELGERGAVRVRHLLQADGLVAVHVDGVPEGVQLDVHVHAADIAAQVCFGDFELGVRIQGPSPTSHAIAVHLLDVRHEDGAADYFLPVHLLAAGEALLDRNLRQVVEGRRVPVARGEAVTIGQLRLRVLLVEVGQQLLVVKPGLVLCLVDRPLSPLGVRLQEHDVLHHNVAQVQGVQQVEDLLHVLRRGHVSVGIREALLLHSLHEGVLCELPVRRPVARLPSCEHVARPAHFIRQPLAEVLHELAFLLVQLDEL
mmetsp:Transcript_68898/g.202265  ORF Transcript_68898/g.202265 Transcript_68898/m.202265 type:complete len:296 (+) Transcript_68898:1352-2239(+)